MILRTLTLAAATITLGALAPAAYAAAPTASQDAPAATRAPRTAQGTGVITEIDAKQAMITLKHDPIPALGRPTMTMPFRANPPDLRKGLKVGQKIGFDTNEGSGLPEITAIRKR
jgi:Cu(I)/Ag(I) efflux system protein CusF